MPYIAGHIPDEVVASYLEARIHGEERTHIQQHLASCDYCRKQMVDTGNSLSHAGLLPPLPAGHPLEHFLLHLRLVVPIQLPILAWHSLLLALTMLVWILALRLEAVPGRYSLWHAVVQLPLSLAMTLHLLWLQPRLRGLVTGFWHAGAPRHVVRQLNAQLSWLQGWPLGGLWLYFGLTVSISLLNTPAVGAASWDWLLETAAGLYSGMAFSALYWAWLWGGIFYSYLALRATAPSANVALLEVGEHQRPLGKYYLRLVQEARQLAFGWLFVSSICITSELVLLGSIPAMRGTVQIGVPVVVLLLVVLWFGHTQLEVRLWLLLRGGKSYAPHGLSWRFGHTTLEVARVLGTLCLALLPLLYFAL